MLSEYKGFHCQHRSDDFPVIAGIIKAYEPKTIIELGTDEGGFSGFLSDLAASWNGEVFTFDIEQKFDPQLLVKFSNLYFKKIDVLTNRSSLVVSLVSRPRTLLYCDNGNKQQEISMYAKSISMGSLLGVHDYNTEVPASWCEPFVKGLGFRPVGHEQMERLRNEWYQEPMTRFWVKAP